MNNLFSDLTISLLNLIKPVLMALLPLITGLIIAYLLSPLVSWFEIRIKSRIISVLFTYILAAGLLFILLYGFIVLIAGTLPQGGLAATVNLVSEYISDASMAVNNFAEKFLPQAGDVIPGDMAAKLQNRLSDVFSLSSAIDLVAKITGGIVSFFLGIVASLYLLIDKEFFIGLWEKFLVLILRQRTHGIINETMSQINTVITTFLKGAFIDSMIIAFLSSLMLTLLDVNFSVIIGIAGGILNIIPYFGPFISMIPAFLSAFFSGGLIHGLAAAAGLFLVQQADANYIYPKIVGSTIGLHPLFVLLSVSICGYFCGIAGMLLAVPAAGILQVLIRRWAYNRE